MGERQDTITQKRYDECIENIKKNKSGTSWILLHCLNPHKYLKTKIWKDEEDKLYWVRGKERIYLKVKSPQEELFKKLSNEYDKKMMIKYPNWENLSHRERKNLSPPSSDDEF